MCIDMGGGSHFRERRVHRGFTGGSQKGGFTRGSQKVGSREPCDPPLATGLHLWANTGVVERVVLL